ncbi:MAG: hypothetical protein WC915_00740 [archaeon]|jgi:hypothetical protein
MKIFAIQNLIFILFAGGFISYLFISSIPINCEEFFYKIDLDTFIEKWENSNNYFVSYLDNDGLSTNYYKNEDKFRVDSSGLALIYSLGHQETCNVGEVLDCGEKPWFVVTTNYDMDEFSPLNSSLIKGGQIILNRYQENHLNKNTHCFEISGNYSQCGVEAYSSADDYKICFFENGIPALFKTISKRFGENSVNFSQIAVDLRIGKNEDSLFEINYIN